MMGLEGKRAKCGIFVNTSGRPRLADGQSADFVMNSVELLIESLSSSCQIRMY